MTTFEAFEAAQRFDLVYAAAAWHWTNPASRWAQAVEMLVPGGVLALFRRQAELKDSALNAAVDEIEKQLLPEAFEAACEKAGQPLSLRRQPGYDHGYYFVQSFMDDHLEHHARQLA